MGNLNDKKYEIIGPEMLIDYESSWKNWSIYLYLNIII
jgi:hypothetical protein